MREQEHKDRYQSKISRLILQMTVEVDLKGWKIFRNQCETIARHLKVTKSQVKTINVHSVEIDKFHSSRFRWTFWNSLSVIMM